MRRITALDIGRAVTQFMKFKPYVAYTLRGMGLPGFSIRRFKRTASV